MLAAGAVDMAGFAVWRIFLGLWCFVPMIVITTGAMHMPRKPVRRVWTACMGVTMIMCVVMIAAGAVHMLVFVIVRFRVNQSRVQFPLNS